ncbi:MAG TPA: hypothetical protein VKB34_16665 [Povalibacter sp.]|nr:hypothetical protein [Povalibacter sp.]
MTTPSVQLLTPIPADVSPATHAAREPANAGSISRFEQLLYAPNAGHAPLTDAAGMADRVARGPGGLPGILNAVEQMSAHWRSGQSAIDQLTSHGTLTMRDLMLLQRELLNSTVNVEISSRATSLLENGIQSIVNRSQ